MISHDCTVPGTVLDLMSNLILASAEMAVNEDWYILPSLVIAYVQNLFS